MLWKYIFVRNIINICAKYNQYTSLQVINSMIHVCIIDSLHFSNNSKPEVVDRLLIVFHIHFYTRTMGIRPENACLPSNWLGRRHPGLKCRFNPTAEIFNPIQFNPYLIFVISFTRAELPENKIYTEKCVNYKNWFCDKIA